ncbi:uncharacterized protein BCR38DRAFT_486091 [Pseudomassariella vexata]|uniref:Uncharacterized protein n=1 Tax=Pseudomassariella vexata TaxID=1141098 RepID=A0A1Y2DVQ8_9PEZI|nr:uncharacterized protein BCR38DRAFT_486091 [Pseudomassariella vexata]ORY63347.1 hypothetical protein BCR38DRAFT_486091 [Pseudomassariella vexata]
MRLRRLLQQKLSKPHSAAEESSPTEEINGRVQDRSTTLFEVPMSIGGYILDGGVRTEAIMQVLRSEIEGMGGCIDTLVSRYANQEPIEGSRKVLINALQAFHKKALLALDIDSKWLT